MTKKTIKQASKQASKQESEQVSETLGYAVIAREEGAQLGDVTHVFFDVETKCISGMTSRKKIFAPESWFGVDQIEVMGKDVILLKNEASLTPVGKGGVVKGNSLKEMRGMRVVTTDGKQLGTLVDLEVQRTDWMISELWLSDDQRLPVVGADIAIGPDQIIVPADYDAKVLREDETSSTPGFLRRIFTKQDTATPQEGSK